MTKKILDGIALLGIKEEEIAQWLESQAHVLRRISPEASEALKGAASGVRSGTYRKGMEDDDTETT